MCRKNFRTTTPLSASISSHALISSIAAAPSSSTIAPCTRGAQHILIVRPVEDADHPARRHLPHAAPQKVMPGLQRRRHLERRHLAALRIDPRKDVPDRAVFARRIHALQHDQHSLLLRSRRAPPAARKAARDASPAPAPPASSSLNPPLSSVFVIGQPPCVPGRTRKANSIFILREMQPRLSAVDTRPPPRQRSAAVR